MSTHLPNHILRNGEKGSTLLSLVPPPPPLPVAVNKNCEKVAGKFR